MAAAGRRSSVGRRIAAGGALLVAVLLAAPAFACSPITRMTVSQPEGAPGSTVQVSGIVAAANGELVKIDWAPDRSESFTPLGTVPIADGKFSRAIQIPSDAGVGVYVIRASIRKGADLQSAEPGRVTFEVKSPSATRPGDTPIGTQPDVQPVATQEVSQPAPNQDAQPAAGSAGQPVTAEQPSRGATPATDTTEAQTPALASATARPTTRTGQAVVAAPVSPVIAAPAATASSEATGSSAPTPSRKSLAADLWSGFTGESSLSNPAAQGAGDAQSSSALAYGLALLTLGTLSIVGVGVAALRRRRAYAHTG